MVDAERTKRLLKRMETTPPWEWPEDAGDVLIGALSEKGLDGAARLQAADMAGELPTFDDRMAETLMAVLRDPTESDELRGLAAISLGPSFEEVEICGCDDESHEMPISQATFDTARALVRDLYNDHSVPKLVRRRALEASVRAGESWHHDAIRQAYDSNDADWRLTAVFCMRFVRGFDKEIAESLNSDNEEIEYEAVCAAGAWSVAGAWRHVTRIIRSEDAPKALVLAAVEAVAAIRPDEAPEILANLADSEDEDIVDAVDEALMMASDGLDEEDDA